MKSKVKSPFIVNHKVVSPHVLGHGHLHTGQLCRHFFLTSGQHEAGNWDPNYTLGVDFLDHDFLQSKNSHRDLSKKGSNFILSSLEVGH